jgi:transcriptional regulator with XRE-family HTH domain
MSMGQMPPRRRLSATPPKPVVRLPTFLRAWREASGYTLDQLATAINERRDWSITGPYLQRIEVGKLQYKQDVLEAIADVLNCTVADLLTRAPRDPDEQWASLTLREKRRLLRAHNQNNHDP